MLRTGLGSSTAMLRHRVWNGLNFTAARSFVTVEKTTPGSSPHDQLLALQSELAMSLRSTTSASFTAEDTDANTNTKKKVLSTRKPLVISAEILELTERQFPKHPALARAHNDHGFVLKSEQEYGPAIDSYVKSLQIYEDCLGRTSPSWVLVLKNLSAVFREAAISKEKPEEREEKDQLCIRAREASDDSLKHARMWLEKVREEAKDEDSMYGEGEIAKAEEMVVDCLVNGAFTLMLQARSLSSSSSGKKAEREKGKVAKVLITKAHGLATEASSDFALKGLKLAKVQNAEASALLALSNPKAALPLFMSALETRREALGDSHDDTVVAMYGVAECYDGLGEKDKATEIREFIIREKMNGL